MYLLIFKPQFSFVFIDESGQDTHKHAPFEFHRINNAIFTFYLHFLGELSILVCLNV